MALRKVVVTGLGALTPLGNNVPAYWAGLLAGRSGASPITYFDTAKSTTRFACELKDFHPQEHFSTKELKKMDLSSQYALVAAEEALQDAQLELQTESLGKIGVIWGTGMGGIESASRHIIEFTQIKPGCRITPFFIPKLLADMPAGHISIKYGLQGPNFATASSCASANNAVISAAQLIQLGYADVMVAGGSEAPITEVGMAGFSAMKALSERNENPTTASRPFDRDRDGFVMGEGAGALILESYEHAIARNAHIYAELSGAGLTADAYHITTPHPEGTGAAHVMQSALNYAGLQPQDIDYINVHGTSTPLGDLSEVRAIQSVFGAHAYKLNISATKSMTGHLLGASGAIESIATILALQYQVVPPTINHFTNDEHFDINLNFTFNQAQHRPLRTALNNIFGFGGHNTAIIYQKWVVS